MDAKIYFSKTNPLAIIPNKQIENAGYDFYGIFEQEVLLKPNEIILISTGIATAFTHNYVLIIKERSSTGMIGMSVRMGVIDSGYRGEIKIGINNTTNKNILFTSEYDKIETTEDTMFYPQSKAIAQGLVLELPNFETFEVPYEELLKFSSQRGTGGFGSTGM